MFLFLSGILKKNGKTRYLNTQLLHYLEYYIEQLIKYLDTVNMSPAPEIRKVRSQLISGLACTFAQSPSILNIVSN